MRYAFIVVRALGRGIKSVLKKFRRVFSYVLEKEPTITN